MPQYNVQLSVIVRIPVEGIAADSPEDAARRALDLPDVHANLARGAAEFDGLIDGARVDLLDAAESRIDGQSVWFEAPELLNAATPEPPVRPQTTRHVTTITALDPDTRLPVEVEIRQTETGLLVGLDGAFPDQAAEHPFSPYEPCVTRVVPDDERGSPPAPWPAGNPPPVGCPERP